MTATPDTRHSLLVRVRRGDERAWTEFAEIYQPLIYRLIRKKGFQHADAEELTQEALVAVNSAIGRFTPRGPSGAFRGWLFRIVKNMMVNFLCRARPAERGEGGTTFRALLEQQPAPTPEAEALFEQEFRRELFLRAAADVRDEVRQSTWDAFWQNGIEGRDIREVAESLGLSLGSVYAARSRIVARMKNRVRQLRQRECDT